MRSTFKKLLIGTSIAASVSAIGTAPANAVGITDVSIGGTAANDYYVYDANNTNTFLAYNGDNKTFYNSDGTTIKTPTLTASQLVQQVLGGNATNPTGNVELAASSEQSNFNVNNSTSLTGTIGGRNITLSSLTASDWTPTFISQWLSQGLSANHINSTIVVPGSGQTSQQINVLPFLSNIFTQYGGRQRFSDPNISYVNQNDTTGLISIGLAGHYDANPLLTSAISGYISANKTAADQSTQQYVSIANALLSQLGTKTIEASEIVKVSYNGGPAQLLYGFGDTTSSFYSFSASGLVAADDGESHSGNYEVRFQGLTPTPASTPEPSALLGLLGVCGVFAAQRQLKKA
ncbi:MAG: NF038130 family PEP-CTERM protein [Stigonema ocellatum SAG 48.90 = DSM 106950]|nr:NF038130 family PEP-CTERM protein [Stigonema ocellatum SAG 48.90 = DSM 106950]